MKKNKFHIFFTAIVMGIALITGTKSHANDTYIDKATGEKAIKLAKRVQSEKLVVTLDEVEFESKLTQLHFEDKVNYLRHVTMDALTLRNKLPKTKLVEIYSQHAQKSNDVRDITLSQLYKLYDQHSDTGGKFNDFDEFRTHLSSYLSNEDWIISHRAKVFLAIAESYTLDLNTALSIAVEAYNQIPNEQSNYVDEAVIESLNLIAYLHNLLNNPELAVDATEELINRRLDKGYDIDGITLINNLIYSFGKWQDFDTTSELAKVLVILEDDKTANVAGLSQLRLAQTLNDKSDYLGSLDAIDSIIGNVEHKTIKANLLINRVVAYAGLGRAQDAEKAFSTYKNFKNGINLTSNNLKSRELMADALMARAKGEMDIAYTKMQERNREKIRRILTSNNAGTSKLLANLENTKERQAERESALKREANLQKSRVEQQKRVNQLLMVLVTLLSLAALLAVIFARYRNKISKELAIKTLEAEDADRMKSEFLGMVSHELRTPLNGIVGIADLLSTQAPTEGLRHKAGIILDSSNKLTHVIESIVDMSTIDGDKMELYPEPTDVHSIVTDLDQLWRPTLEDKGVTFTSFVESSLVDDIIIDKARFRQCLNNLLSNAAKFTDSGRVHLHVTTKPIDETGETEVTAIVADTGQGMSQTVQGKLFTPFLQADSTMTRKHGGSGLGLAITQSLARMMGGDVTMVSNLNRGSEFTLTVRGKKSDTAQILDDVEELMTKMEMAPISAKAPSQETTKDSTLPILDEPEYELPGQTAPVKPKSSLNVPFTEPTTSTQTPNQASVNLNTDDLRGLKILIVEDIPANQDVIKLFLGPEGCQSQCAVNGVEALDILNTQAIDVILMDIRMPEMDGIEATRAIRNSGREYKNTPIIALTADVSAETNAACMAAGADIFLTKPVIARDLIEAIRFVRRFQDHDDDEAINAA